MSCNTAILIEVDKINIDDNGINKLKESEYNSSEHYDIKDDFRTDCVKFSREFNYDAEKIYPILSILEPYLLYNEDAIEIGEIYDETDTELEGKIYSYKGRLFIMYIDTFHGGYCHNEYEYKIKTTDGLEYKLYLDDYNINGALNNLIVLLQIKHDIENISMNTKYKFVNNTDSNKVFLGTVNMTTSEITIEEISKSNE